MVINSNHANLQEQMCSFYRADVNLVSFAAVFWDDTQCSSKEGGALRDIPKTRQSMTACSLLRLLLRI